MVYRREPSAIETEATQAFSAALVAGIRGGEAFTRELILAIREDHEARLAAAVPGSHEALLCFWVIANCDFVADRKPLPADPQLRVVE